MRYIVDLEGEDFCTRTEFYDAFTRDQNSKVAAAIMLSELKAHAVFKRVPFTGYAYRWGEESFVFEVMDQLVFVRRLEDAHGPYFERLLTTSRNTPAPVIQAEIARRMREGARIGLVGRTGLEGRIGLEDKDK